MFKRIPKLVPADKGAINISVVCKRYCLEVICKELGLWPGATSSDTYIPKTMDPKEISGNNISYVKSLGFKEQVLELLLDTKNSQIIVSLLHH